MSNAGKSIVNKCYFSGSTAGDFTMSNAGKFPSSCKSAYVILAMYMNDGVIDVL